MQLFNHYLLCTSIKTILTHNMLVKCESYYIVVENYVYMLKIFPYCPV